jgi:hypothetical protein
MSDPKIGPEDLPPLPGPTFVRWGQWEPIREDTARPRTPTAIVKLGLNRFTAADWGGGMGAVYESRTRSLPRRTVAM